MFKKTTKRGKQSKLEEEIDWVRRCMRCYDPHSQQYSAMAENLDRLYKAKSHESGRKISWDTIAIIGGNIVITVLVLNFEKANVLTTKALGYLIKGRV